MGAFSVLYFEGYKNLKMIKRYFIISLMILSLSATKAFAGLDLCSTKETKIMPGFVFSKFNQNPMFGANLSFQHGSFFCLWQGAYVEFQAGQNEQKRAGIGGFMGVLFFGIDASAHYYSESENSYMMYRIKPFFTFRVIDLYLGLLLSPHPTAPGFATEFGFLFKLPIWSKSH